MFKTVRTDEILAAILGISDDPTVQEERSLASLSSRLGAEIGAKDVQHYITEHSEEPLDIAYFSLSWIRRNPEVLGLDHLVIQAMFSAYAFAQWEMMEKQKEDAANHD